MSQLRAIDTHMILVAQVITLGTSDIVIAITNVGGAFIKVYCRRFMAEYISWLNIT